MALYALNRVLSRGVRKVLRGIVGPGPRLALDGDIAGFVAFDAASEFRAAGSRAASSSNVFLCFLSVISGISPQGRSGASGVVAGEVGNLLGLGTDNVLGVGDVRVDEFFVGFVDQGG